MTDGGLVRSHRNMSSRLCGHRCACKVVDRAIPLDGEVVTIMCTIKSVLTDRDMWSAQAQVQLERVKCRQPLWAHVLSMPLTLCYPYTYACTLLYATARDTRLQGLTPWLVDQGVCLYSGLFAAKHGWSTSRPLRWPRWTESVYHPLSAMSSFGLGPSCRLLLSAGAWPACGDALALQQWRRWHGRYARRVAISTLCAAKEA